MSDLLFLAHRIPWPPDKGDKIRSYHLLRHLASRYTVHLGAFIDDPRDWQHESALRQVCGDVKLIALGSVRTRARAAAALLTGAPFTSSCYADGQMSRWVADTVQRHAIGHVLAFSSSMAQYAMDLQNAVRVIDFVDVDSIKWRQYSASRRGPARWLYRREARLLGELERSIARRFDASLFVSAAEARVFSALAPDCSGRIGWFDNGVDADYFSPSRVYPNPYPGGEQSIVFTGAMNYWPNIDAVRWFATEIFPSIRAAAPNAVFTIAGARPSGEVSMLAQLDGVRVTGPVPDIRPWLNHAAVAVAPMRVARGVQNKVLEAMAMGKRVVASPEAMEGIDACDGRELIVARGAAGFANAVLTFLHPSTQETGMRMGRQARTRILERYGWSDNLARIDLALASVFAPGRDVRSALNSDCPPEPSHGCR